MLINDLKQEWTNKSISRTETKSQTIDLNRLQCKTQLKILFTKQWAKLQYKTSQITGTNMN